MSIGLQGTHSIVPNDGEDDNILVLPFEAVHSFDLNVGQLL
jgi:hypothetical protein